ncbi:MAG TPA: cytochrome c oxidase assembly protein [Methylomirabilota bacterium]|jgi:putative membrane protein
MTAAAAPWTTGEMHVDVLLGIALVGAAYVLAYRRAGRAVEWGRAAAFVAGLAALAGALNGPLHDLSDYYLFSAHMIQHVVLTLVVAPLLLLGTPTFMVDGLTAPLLGRPLAGAALRWITRPLPALALYAAALALWHLPGPYELALEHHGWHVIQHLVLIATAVLGWWPVLSASASLPPASYPAQILYLFAFGMPMTAVAAMITAAEQPLYPFYAAAPRITGLDVLADQRLGGLIMWVPAGLVPLVAFTVVFFRWTASEPDDTEIDDAPAPTIAS